LRSKSPKTLAAPAATLAWRSRAPKRPMRRSVFVLAGLALALLAAPSTSFGKGPTATQYRTEDQLLANHYLGIEAGLLHIAPVFEVKVKEVGSLPVEVNGYAFSAGAVTEPFDASGGTSGPETRCLIKVASLTHHVGVGLVPVGPGHPPEKNIAVLASLDKDVMAHEVFHCLSAQLAGTIANFHKDGEWLIEGAAEWAGSDLVANDPTARVNWDAYLSTPHTPLFKRDYDAIGFFGHLSASGISPWRVFGAMFAASGNAAAYQASGAEDPFFLETEASAFFNDPALGNPWTPGHQDSEAADSNVPDTKAQRDPVRVKDSESQTLAVPAYTDGVYELRTAAPVTHITVEAGYVHLKSLTPDHPLDEQKVKSLWLCDGTRKCECPEGQQPEFHDLTAGDLAVAAGPTPAAVQVTASCKLPSRSCVGLIAPSDFNRQVLAGALPYGPAEVVLDAQVRNRCDYVGHAEVGNEVVDTVEAICGHKCETLEYGSVLLGTYASEADARGVYSNFIDGVPGYTPVPGLGSEAAVDEDGAGGMVVDNDFVFVTGFKTPDDTTIDARTALEQIEGELVGG
jgi:hypothetical protein